VFLVWCEIRSALCRFFIAIERSVIVKSINPNPDTIGQVLAGIPQGKPVVMLNLLKFAEQADYPQGYTSVDTPCSGRVAYDRYAASIEPYLSAVGGELVFLGAAVGGIIIPDGEAWDKVLLVRYPSINAFHDMLKNPDYQAETVHRTAALDDSRLVAMIE
jgi:uncharacterized protein (DUF1330 family)